MIIAILDDDLIDLDIISSYVFDYLKFNDIEANIIKYCDPTKIISCRNVDCFIIDVFLPNANGVELAPLLLNNNPLAKIIFVSASSEFSPPSHKVRPIGFLLKPLDKKELFDLLDCFMKIYEFHFITIKDNCRHFRKIYINEILTISPYDYKNNTKIVFLNNKEVIAKMNLNEWIELLDTKHFVRSYKNVLVNIQNIVAIKNRIIKFSDGSDVSCSRTYIQEIEQSFYDYLDLLTWQR